MSYNNISRTLCVYKSILCIWYHTDIIYVTYVYSVHINIQIYIMCITFLSTCIIRTYYYIMLYYIYIYYVYIHTSSSIKSSEVSLLNPALVILPFPFPPFPMMRVRPWRVIITIPKEKSMFRHKDGEFLLHFQTPSQIKFMTYPNL